MPTTDNQVPRQLDQQARRTEGEGEGEGGARKRRRRRIRIAILLLLGSPISWVGYRLIAEHTKLQGSWQVLPATGEPIVGQGASPEVTLTWPRFWVNPFLNPKQLNVVRGLSGRGDGVWKYIYRWDGDRIQFFEASPGLARPTSFDPNQEIVIEPGSSGGAWGLGYLERPKRR